MLTIEKAYNLFKNFLYATKQKIWQFKNGLLDLFEIQLFLNPILTLILSSWGIQVSLFGFLTSIIFYPIIFSFVFVFIFLYLFEFLRIPNLFLANILDLISWSFFEITNILDPLFISLSFKIPNIFISTLTILGLVLTTILITNKSYTKRILYLILYNLFLFYFLYAYSTLNNNIIVIPCAKKPILVIKNKNIVNFFDFGGTTQISNIKNYFHYKIKTQLTKNGINEITNILIYKYSARSLELAAEICKNFKVKKIYLLEKRKPVSFNGWKALEEIYTLAKDNKIRLIIKKSKR